VVGLVGIAALQSLALILRLLGNGCRHLGTLAQRLYDLPLFVPLWIESRRLAHEAVARSRLAVAAEPWKEVQS
jgi:hypothetical protein